MFDQCVPIKVAATAKGKALDETLQATKEVKDIANWLRMAQARRCSNEVLVQPNWRPTHPMVEVPAPFTSSLS